MQVDVNRFMGELHGYIARALQPLLDRLKAVEGLAPQRGDKGEPGRDADPVTDARLIEIVAGHFSRNPPPKGEPGQDASPVTDAQVSTALERYLKANPPAKGDKGEPGRDADPISLADVVRELLQCDELKSLVELRAKEAVAVLPVPKPGRDADPITDVQISATVERYLKANPPARGDKGDPGTDGVGLAGFLIDRDGILVATTSKGEAVRLGQVVGRDGLGFEDVDFEYDGERTVTAKFVRGGAELKRIPWRFPVIIDRGYWKLGFKAEKGDAVTHDGTLWIALRDTGAKPSTEAKDDWRIGVRKGRDGNPPPVKIDGA
jgi:hypothetical protein